ncbi:MAG: hypothetical protein KIT48_09680 [Pseudolabrys sp.]|nr:hypothetical protein [Pseudolabrys sp.]
MEMKNSLAHPQGDKAIRKVDHVGIIDCYISRVENGKLEVKKRIPHPSEYRAWPDHPRRHCRVFPRREGRRCRRPGFS